MKKIMVTGALGQIGSELIAKLRSEYGTDNVLATDIRRADSTGAGPFEILDVTMPIKCMRSQRISVQIR